jgi:hypothetical protein
MCGLCKHLGHGSRSLLSFASVAHAAASILQARQTTRNNNETQAAHPQTVTKWMHSCCLCRESVVQVSASVDATTQSFLAALPPPVKDAAVAVGTGVAAAAHTAVEHPRAAAVITAAVAVPAAISYYKGRYAGYAGELSPGQVGLGLFFTALIACLFDWYACRLQTARLLSN